MALAVALAQLLVDDGVVLRRVFLQIVGLGGGKIGEAFLHDLRQLSGLFKAFIIVFPADARDFRGYPQRNRRQHNDQTGQHAVFQEHGHGDHGNLKSALHHHVKNLVNVAAHFAHVVDHPVQNIAHRGLVDVFHREPPDFVGNGNAQAVGKMTAHRPVHQLHV